jgi:hypothetical protein
LGARATGSGFYNWLAREGIADTNPFCPQSRQKSFSERRINMSTPAEHLKASRTNVGTPLEPSDHCERLQKLRCKNLVLKFQLFDWWGTRGRTFSMNQ